MARLHVLARGMPAAMRPSAAHAGRGWRRQRCVPGWPHKPPGPAARPARAALPIARLLQSKAKAKAKPAAPQQPSLPASTSARSGSPPVPLLRAAPPPAQKARGPAAARGGPAVPDMFMLPPDARAKWTESFARAVGPSEETLGRIAADPVLSQGFEDPEIMAAVAEVARDPDAFEKYKGNPKVARFYRTWAGMLGERLQEVGALPPGGPPAEAGGGGSGACCGDLGISAREVRRRA
jgi:hypothetical protein